MKNCCSHDCNDRHEFQPRYDISVVPIPGMSGLAKTIKTYKEDICKICGISSKKINREEVL